MSQLTMTAAEFRRSRIGSYAAHEQLQTAVLTFLALNGLPAVPIHTGPRVRPRKGGGWDLKHNRAQAGLADVLTCFPPHGRLGLLELKTGRARRSREQRESQRRFEAAGALCLEIRDVRQLLPHMPTNRTSFGAGRQPGRQLAADDARDQVPPRSTSGRER